MKLYVYFIDFFSIFFKATELLKKAQGVVVLTVCNPNVNKVEQKEKEKDKTKLGAEASDIAQKTPQKSAPSEFKMTRYILNFYV